MSGITLVTPPMITKLCTPMIVVRPAAKSLENGRSDCTAMRKPEPTNSRIVASTATVPSSPSSSPIAENTKSVAALGICCGLPSPRPVPANPPVPNANIDWTIWKPLPCDTVQGSIQVPTRSCT